MHKIILLLTGLTLWTSCTEKTDGFVNSNAAEFQEALFRSNHEELRRGAYFKFNFESQLEPETPENRLRLSKLREMYEQINRIDECTAKMISGIEQLKMELLQKNGERTDFKTSNLYDESKLVWSAYDLESPLLPARLNLKAMDAGKFPAYNPFVKDAKPTARGRKLWNDLIKYRTAVVNLTASYNTGSQSFSLNVQPINAFQSEQDLTHDVRQMIARGNANQKEDAQTLQDMYIGLTKREKDERGVHWIVSQLGDLPLAAQVNKLSVLQNEVIHARTTALSLISSKSPNCGNTLFTQIKFTMLAPDKAKRNEELKMHVFLAAYEYFLKPEFTCNEGKIESCKDGVALLKIKAGGSKEMKLSGTVSFELPYGELAVLPWEKVVRIED